MQNLKTFGLILLIISFSCSGIKKHNKNLYKKYSIKEINKDVDYVYRKLIKLHPNLYLYISEENLKFKFDSLKSSINTPLTSNELYFKFSPIICSIRDGHAGIAFPKVERISQKKRKENRKKGTSPYYLFDYEIFNNKVYITENRSSNSQIRVGSEVVSVNNIEADYILNKWKNCFSADGYIQTLYKHLHGQIFGAEAFFEVGLKDSLSYKLKYNDTIKNYIVSRNRLNVKTDSIPRRRLTEKEKLSRDEEREKKVIQGYDSIYKKYSTELSYLNTDSSIALIKIRDFSKSKYKKFYSTSFSKLDSLHTGTLILDLRDNGGGKLKDVFKLYSYLIDTDYYFVDKAKVTNKFSELHTRNFINASPGIKIEFLILSPLFYCKKAITILHTKKEEDGNYYFRSKESQLSHPAPENFKGKIYVIINGGCFSATCILASNLAGSGRATFVGEETGGAYNGCTAYKLPLFKLPNTGLKIRFGLYSAKPHFHSGTFGRGIKPDVEILPSIQDRINGVDPELEWILTDIERSK